MEDRAARVERITNIGSWEWDLATNAVWWSDELYRIYGLEPQSCAITLESFLERVHPDDRAHTRSEVQAALGRGGRFGYPERIVRPDGSIRLLETQGEVVMGPDQRPRGLVGTCRDVTEERRAEHLARVEHEILEAVVAGTPLQEILARITVLIEETAPGSTASILLVDDDGARMIHGAAPSLPDEYNRAIDGAPIGPCAGSCGTAAYRRQPVYVTDVETDPLWVDWRSLIRPHGLRACWSTPFLSRDGHVLGTFAVYYREPRSPTEEEIRLIDRAAHISAVAVENRQLEAQLHALAERLEHAREEERTAIAREIHDELGQALTALKMEIAKLSRHGGETVSSQTAVMSRMTDAILDQVRKISSELRPGVLDDLGLEAAMEWQAEKFEESTGTACLVSTNVGGAPLPKAVSTAVFRIFQEALTNVTRHAHASYVDASLTCTEGWLRLDVRDDGKGISPEALSSRRSLGLLGIRERAQRMGGSVVIEPASGGGTSLRLRLPLTVRSGTER